MSIRTKVVGCFLIILALFIGVSAYNYARFRQANARLQLVNEFLLPFSKMVVQLQGNIFSVAEDMRRVYFQKDSSSDGSNFSRMVRDLYPYLVHKRFNALERILAKDEDKVFLATIGDLTSMVAQVKNSFTKLTSTTDKVQFETTYAELRLQIQAISKRVDDECQKITLSAQNEGRESLVSSIFLCAITILLVSFTFFFSHRVLEPLPLLISSIRKITDGDFNQSLKVSSADKDEVSLLAREYNRMLAGLQERDRKIQAQQKEILQTERLAAVGQLSAEIVHEIRNPLNSICLNIDWLENELTGIHPEVSKTLRSISREIERLNQITESYLVRARVPSQDNQKTPVNDLLREILEFSKEEDKARNIQVEATLAPHEIFVKSDRSRLKQAFLNVIRNAREAMPRGGKLHVRTELRENVYRIQFSDSGYGMNDAIRNQTFHPFYTTKTNGTGLGLAVTKAIVEEAQGSIQCESQIGEGTTFTFQFPV